MPDDLVAGGVEDRDLTFEDRDERIARVADPIQHLADGAVRSSPSAASVASWDADSIGLSGVDTLVSL